MTKEYLKMTDAFVDEVVSDSDCMLSKSLGEIADFSGYKKECRYAAHAINSHDELVAEVEMLNVLLKCASEVIRFCCEDLGDDDAATFMRIWSGADWDALRAEYPEADEIVYAADPTWSGWKVKK